MKKKKQWKGWLNKDCHNCMYCRTYSYPADNFKVHYYCGLHPNSPNTNDVVKRKYKACREFKLGGQ